MQSTNSPIPPLDNINAWLDYWYYEMGRNPIPATTRYKTAKKGVEWTEWQTRSLPEEQFNQWKLEGAYSGGIAIPAGKSWRGPYEGKYFTFIDLDNAIAIKEFCSRNGTTIPLSQVAEMYLVEQHLDNQNKCHVYFFSEIPFRGKSSDQKQKDFDEEHQPAIEIKGRGTHGVAFCTPSYHKHGHQYQIIGTAEPMILTATAATEMMEHLDNICTKYGLKYLEYDNGDGKALTPMCEMEKEDFVILEGHNRHEALMRYMESRIVVFSHKVPLQEIKELCYIWNQQHCKPPLDDKEFEKQWNYAKKYIDEKAPPNNKGKAKQQQQQSDSDSEEDDDNDGQKNEQQSSSSSSSLKIEETSKETRIRELTEALERTYHFASMEDTGELFYYADSKGKYEPAEGLVKSELEHRLHPGVTSDTVTNVIEKLARRHQHKRTEFDPDLYIFNMANRLYDVRTNTLRPHTWEYLSLRQHPIKCDLKIRPKKWGKFMREVLYPNQIRTAVEAMAYTFLRDNPFELYFILLGFGSNGKSVLMHVLTKLHGEDNVSNTSLARLLDDRFAKKDLEGKNVNIDMEMSKATIDDMSVLKELTGSQPTRIRPMYREAYTTRLWAKHFFSTNEMPQMNDYTDAHYRREVIISFPNQFVDGVNANPNLKHELTTDEELSGIFNALMIPLRRIALEHKPPYMDAKTIEERKLKHQLSTDPVRAFLDTAVEPTDYESDPDITKEDLYEGYKHFCAHYKLPWDKYDPFCKVVKATGLYKEGRERQGGRKRTWVGIRLKKDPFNDSLTT